MTRESTHMSPPGTARQAISRGMVALLKKNIGRGATTARTFINDDVVTVVLQDTLTEVERTLTQAGKGDAVKAMREHYAEVLCEQAVKLVERATEREVVAAMSDHSVLPDYAVHCFVLAPREASPEPDVDPCGTPNGAETTPQAGSSQAPVPLQ